MGGGAKKSFLIPSRQRRRRRGGGEGLKISDGRTSRDGSMEFTRLNKSLMLHLLLALKKKPIKVTDARSICNEVDFYI